MSNRCLTHEEERRLRKLLQHRSDPKARRDWAWMRALLTTGMRIHEFSTLTVGEIRTALSIGYLFVPKARRKMEACDLTVHLAGEARDAFEDLLMLRPGAAAGEPLVVSRNGSAMTDRAYQQALKTWAEQAKVDARISPHWFRHAFAAGVVESSTSENPVFVVARLSRLLGHADERSCMKYLTMSRHGTTDSAAMVERAFPSRRRMTPARVKREFERRATA